jgi:hypothetical protein
LLFGLKTQQGARLIPVSLAGVFRPESLLSFEQNTNLKHL